MIESGKQYKYVIDISSRGYRLQTLKVIFEPYIFNGWTQWRHHRNTIYLSLEFIIVKYKKRFFGGYVEQITKIILNFLGGLLVLLYKMSIQSFV